METKKKQKAKPVNKDTQKVSWYIIDAGGAILGKVAVAAAKALLEKTKAEKKSFEIPTDHVVVINASKVAVTGRKEKDKKYYRYSGYPSGLKVRTLEQMRQDKPTEIVSHAVAGMLPKNRLGRKIKKHLYVYPGSTHPHEAQKPESIEVK